MRKKSITVESLKSVLLAHFNSDQSKQAKLQERFQQALGGAVQEKTPEAIIIEKRLLDWLSDILARRLKRNRRTTPLFSSRDLVRFVPIMLNEIAEIEGEELEAEERKMLKKFMEMMFENIVKAVYAMMPPQKDPYKEYWRWIMTVFDLAAERGVPPAELLVLEEAIDEITRRMFTKKQFVALSKKGFNKLVNADALKKILVQPMLDMLSADGSEEERQEMEREIEAEIMPQLREAIEKAKVVMNGFFDEEAARIYALA